MLFNSYVFLLGYLPITLVGFFWLGRRSQRGAMLWLAGASLLFYGAWDYRYLPLLLGSILLNYTAGRLLCSFAWERRRKVILVSAIAADLALLGYYKYANFFVGNLNDLADLHFVVGAIVLPLGISFFTFTQIAFLVDAYRGKARELQLVPYVLFVTYFPHLVAGPILHHAEMMPQFQMRETYRFDADRFATGVLIFVMGLFKKTVLADNVAVFVAPVFDGATSPMFADAWAGALAYTFQLYFDFSGYSDMAIGLSLMMNIDLPLNFNSPYKAASIVDFWRRWHMTLSRFLRDYLYFSLGGNRQGPFRRHINLLVTMVLGGLWHGAGWTFVIWGTLHGSYLIVNHAWNAASARLGARPLPHGLGVGLTFIAVVVGWVFFRASSVDRALHVLAGMAGLNGCDHCTPAVLLTPVWAWCAALAVIAFSFSNTQEIIASLAKPDRVVRTDRLSLGRSLAWAGALGVLAAGALISLPQPTSFIYFNF